MQIQAAFISLLGESDGSVFQLKLKILIYNICAFDIFFFLRHSNIIFVFKDNSIQSKKAQAFLETKIQK